MYLGPMNSCLNIIYRIEYSKKEEAAGEKGETLGKFAHEKIKQSSLLLALALALQLHLLSPSSLVGRKQRK